MNKYGLKLYNNREKVEVGLDECARGCLFGRTYAAAVVWNPEFLESALDDPEYSLIHCIRDSKKMSATKRKQVSEFIKENCLDYSIQWADEKEIDHINILKAVQRCFHTSLDSLSLTPEKIYVDGTYFKKYKNIPYECIEKGDNYYVNIASASILAKVAHDEYIEEFCRENPEIDSLYGISSNMGYGTKKHLDGITEHGITQFHRRTFGICKRYIPGAGPLINGGDSGNNAECDDDGVCLNDAL